ncbi:MAG: MBL fold metallo-hydrolase [Anaerolineaceae bacterium]
MQIKQFILGPIENNTFLLFDDVSKDAVVIDPSFDIDSLIQYLANNSLTTRQVLITHAHFDHIAGVNRLIAALPDRPLIGLHPGDLPLWKDRGEALHYDFNIDLLPDPNILFKDEETLSINGVLIVVHHTPGHSPGHVVFSLPEVKTIFCGDVIFAGSIGRTDLNGGNQAQLINSIQKEILNSPDKTRLLTGHGPETTVGFERRNNPYLK